MQRLFTEISELDMAFSSKHHIVQLQITIDDSIVVQEPQTNTNLCSDELDCLFREVTHVLRKEEGGCLLERVCVCKNGRM